MGVFVKGKYTVFAFFLCVLLLKGFEGDGGVCPVECVYAIPGQNGYGSDLTYVKAIFADCSDVSVVSVATPANPDLGQSVCMGCLRNAFLEGNPKSVIIHATSQGTATALNYLAYEDKGRHIKGLVLESVLASGNSAIYHTARGPLFGESLINRLIGLPFSYYWAPYIAKVLMPYYWPSGSQPIKSIEHIPTNIPIIIIHSKRDMQLSYNDACALYYGLRMRGNDNVYLISKEGGDHLWLMGKKDNMGIQDFIFPAVEVEKNDKDIVLNILQRCGLINPSVPLQAIDLREYQPDPAPFKELYDDLVRKETCHRYIGYGFGAAIAGATLYVAQYFYKKLV